HAVVPQTSSNTPTNVTIGQVPGPVMFDPLSRHEPFDGPRGDEILECHQPHRAHDHGGHRHMTDRHGEDTHEKDEAHQTGERWARPAQDETQTLLRNSASY